MSNTSSKKKSSNKLSSIVKAPYRVLIGIRNLYVGSLSGCAGRVQQGGVIASRVPRSQSHGFNISRGGDDINELIRAASQGRLGPVAAAMQREAAAGVVPRSQSVGVGKAPPMMIGRIDEEEASAFESDRKEGGGGGGGGGGDVFYPRSRSCAVVAKGKVGVMMSTVKLSVVE